jgi:hypothetical protein
VTCDKGVGYHQSKTPKWTYVHQRYFPNRRVGRWESDDNPLKIVDVYGDGTFEAYGPYCHGFPEPLYGSIGVFTTLRGAQHACEQWYTSD